MERLVGRIEQAKTNFAGVQFGLLSTPEGVWYSWHGKHVKQGMKLAWHDLVTFEPAPPNPGYEKPSALNLELIEMDEAA